MEMFWKLCVRLILCHVALMIKAATQKKSHFFGLDLAVIKWIEQTANSVFVDESEVAVDTCQSPSLTFNETLGQFCVFAER